VNTAVIFKVQKYSIHDGPGIRTTVFFKGCPLRCIWCHNPESFRPEPMRAVDMRKCTRCLACVRICPTGAIGYSEQFGFTYDPLKCTRCHACETHCPTNAGEFFGQRMTPDELYNHIRGDFPFYDESGGGITFSGGEPFQQAEFLLEMLKRCKEDYVHTLVDTCFYTKWENVEAAAPLTRMFYADLKHMDPEKHKAYTGVSNELILDNIRKLSKIHKGIIGRIPFMPGCNADEENIRATGAFLAECGIERVHILPYHNFATHKYQQLGMAYTAKDITVPDNELKNLAASWLRDYLPDVRIGG